MILDQHEVDVIATLYSNGNLVCATPQLSYAAISIEMALCRKGEWLCPRAELSARVAGLLLVASVCERVRL